MSPFSPDGGKEVPEPGETVYLPRRPRSPTYDCSRESVRRRVTDAFVGWRICGNRYDPDVLQYNVQSGTWSANRRLDARAKGLARRRSSEPGLRRARRRALGAVVGGAMA